MTSFDPNHMDRELALLRKVEVLVIENARLREALEAVLVRDSEWGLSGLRIDCGCPRLSARAEREYETGKCPHQRARAALKGSEDEA